MNPQEIPRSARRLAFALAFGAVLIGSVTLSSSAQAQDQQRDPRQMVDQRMAALTETLKLDSAQQGKVRSIVADEIMAMEELRKNGGGRGEAGGERGGGGRGGMGGRGGRRGGGGGGGDADGGAPADSSGRGPSPEMRAIRDRSNKQIEKLLNPDQLKTYQQLFEQGQQQRPPQR